MQKANTGARFLAALIIFSLVGQIAWVVENMYFNVFMYKMFNASAADISLMVAASAIAATVTTLLIGALSDKVGKRKVFICGGYILWGISILCFSFIRTDLLDALFPTVSAPALAVTLVIVLDCVMTFFGSSANDACFNAWLTHATHTGNRGAAEGINAMMPLIAILAVFGGFMSFDLSQPESWTAIFTIIGGAALLIGILGILLIEDTAVKIADNRHYFKNIFYGFRPSVVRGNKTLYAVLLIFAVFGISIQIFMPYLILYYTVSLGLENYVLIMAAAVIIAAAVTAFYGRLYDKHGFFASVYPSLCLLMVGYILLFSFTDAVPVFIGSLLMMTGYLTGMAVFGAMLRDRTPENKAGMFQGLRIVGQVLIPGIIGPAIGAKVLANADTVLNDDGTASFIPNENIFLAALAVAAVALVMVTVMQLVKRKRSKNGN